MWRYPVRDMMWVEDKYDYMIDLLTGKIGWDNMTEASFEPMLSKENYLSGEFHRRQIEAQNCHPVGRNGFVYPHLSSKGKEYSIEIRFGRNNFLENLIIRSAQAAQPQTWEDKENAKEIAQAIKRDHDAFLAQESALSTEIQSPDKELRFDAPWGSICSVMELTEIPDVKITIRYRNLGESEKSQYLNLGRKHLHGEK